MKKPGISKPRNPITQKPITLKGWIYDENGNKIMELIKTSFLEFYFAKKDLEISQKT